MRFAPMRPGRAVLFGFLLWLMGMFIGMVVFAVPALQSADAIPGITANPFITLPILIGWIIAARLLTRRHLSDAPPRAAEGLRLGFVYCAVNVALDRVMVVGLMGAGQDFYAYLGPWLAYSSLIVVPWLTARNAR